MHMKKKNLKKLKQFWTKYGIILFNPQSHNDDVEVYKSELKSAIEAVKDLSDISSL